MPCDGPRKAAIVPWTALRPWANLRAMTRISLTQRILLVILAVQAALFAALAFASLEGARRDIAAETRLAVETARALVLATVGTMHGAVPPDRIMQLLPERLVVPRHVTLGTVDVLDGVVRRARALNCRPCANVS